MKKFNLGLIQHKNLPDKEANLDVAEAEIAAAAEKGADLIVLPECFVCDSTARSVAAAAEHVGEEITERLSAAAKKYRVWIHGGSFPETDDRVPLPYNTTLVFRPDGSIAAKYRKLQLFDAELDGKKLGSESEMFSEGDEIVTYDAEFAKIGAAICYDVRFPYIFEEAARRGVELTILPAAFSAVTGPLYWDLLVRARATDTTMYVAGCNAVSHESNRYQAYGHTLVADPRGRVLGSLGGEPGILVTEIDPAYSLEVRRQLPVVEANRQKEILWD